MRKYKYRIKDNDYDVTIDSISGDMAKVDVNGIAFDVEMLSMSLSEDELPEVAASNNAAVSAPSSPGKEETLVAGTAGEGIPIKAPLPGVIRSISVKVGQSVKKGETVLVLEAMKMENNISAEQDGTITGIAIAVGSSVMEGDIMLTIA